MRYRWLALGVAGLALMPLAAARAGHAAPGPALGPVVDVSRTPHFAEGEETVAVNPLDDSDVIVGSNQWQPAADSTASLSAGPSGFTQCAVWSTLDNGSHWSGGPIGIAGAGPTPNPLGPLYGAPAEFSDPGNAISADQNVLFNRRGQAFYQCAYSGTAVRDAQVWVFRSDDGGLHWRRVSVGFSEADTGIQIDRPFLALDTSGGPRDGWLYLCWETMFYQPYLPAVYCRTSSDSGRSWGPVVRVDDSAHEAMWDPREYPVVGGDGAVYVVYDAAPFASPAPNDQGSKDITLMVARSTDGGRTFRRLVVRPHVVRNDDPDEAEPGFSELISAVAADPRRPGRVAVAWPDAAGGVSRVWLSTSADGGRSWGAPVEVSGLPAASPVQEDHVALAYLPGGDLAVVWRDRRNSAGGFADPWDVYARVFTATGPPRPLGAPLRVTARSQPVTTHARGDMPSEYLGVTVAPDGGLVVSWDQLAGVLPDDVMRRVPPGSLAAPAG